MSVNATGNHVDVVEMTAVGASRLAAVPIVAIVAASAGARFFASRSLDAPWIAPDEMIYGLLGRSLWTTGRDSLIGDAGGFYGGYPLLVGLPLHLLSPGAGVAVIQLGQAVLMSLAAAATWAWARPLAGNAWALSAGVLTACLPALAYSGLLMSEAAFLPAATLALWFAARAIADPSPGRQAALIAALAIASAARLQGVVLVPVLATAALLAALFARDRRVLSRLTPTWIVLAVLGVAVLILQLGTMGDGGRPFGAYSGVVSTSYDGGEAARWILYHAGDVFLLVVGIPLVALGVLAYGAARGRERDPAVRALVAVSVSSSVWLTVQVGTFASRYVGHLAERDLIIVAPPLFACLAVWLARGLPRPQPSTSIVGLMVATPALLLPVRAVITPHAVPDAFMTVPLAHLLERTSGAVLEGSWTVLAALLVAVSVTIPRRASVILPLLVGVGLAGSSVLASSEISKLARADQHRFFGEAEPSWINDAATGPVTYLYDGSSYWNGVWKAAFWNDRIQRVARLPGPVTGALPATVVRPRQDGALLDSDGVRLGGREIVASTAFTFFGDPVAEVAQFDIDQAGLTMWRSPGPPRLSTWVTGVKPNGDIVESVRVHVYDCGQGALDLTLFGKHGTPIEIDVDGVAAARLSLASGQVWNGSIPVLKDADGARVCTFEIRSAGLVGSTKIAFVRS